MTSPLLDALIGSPILPELIQEAQRALGKERLLREKFYADITPEHKWEFIQGEVVMHSPALNRHLMATMGLFGLLAAHVRVGNLGAVYIEKAMTCFPRNDYEPDIMFFGPAKRALIDPDTLKFPIPDLIVEVLSPSTEHRDRGIKFQDYALHGVGEYWIIDPVAETVELHRLPEGADAYPAAPKQAEGSLHSDVVPGFEIPVRAIFDEDENARSMKAIWSAQS
ncbi:MAG: Uma2 family endonuclease [Verrucomicrobiota bacterium]